LKSVRTIVGNNAEVRGRSITSKVTLRHERQRRQWVGMSDYDTVAASFDRYRALGDGVPRAIRAAILQVVALAQPRLLDLGAGTGRIGHAFVAARDDYIGVDLSLGMLREFTWRLASREAGAPRLIQADGAQLPFPDAAFDAVMMMQVLGAVRRCRPFVDEALRVLRAPGTLLIGHTVMPPDGVDARMKQQLASLIDEMGVPPYHRDARAEVVSWLGSIATGRSRVVGAEWETTRTPAGFLARQPTGAQFSGLLAPIKDAALGKLSAWAAASFGSLQAEFRERHAFELDVFKFQQAKR
jgi:ubiquinone/menaquinone biosynthesis C-methylase UbiE